MKVYVVMRDCCGCSDLIQNVHADEKKAHLESDSADYGYVEEWDVTE